CFTSPASISLDALYAKKELCSSLPTCLLLHHGILRDDRSTTQDLCVCRSGCSRCIAAPCSITSPALSALDCATRSRPIVACKCARSSQNALSCCVCLARCPRYNPHRRATLLHPAL